MAYISEISPDGGTTRFDIKDKNAQKKQLTTPITVRGQSKTTVEDTLSALAQGYSSYVDDDTLYLPTNASVSQGVLIIS